MNRGRARHRIYLNQADYQRFIHLLSETCAMWGIRVHAYSLMPNHYHLVLETPRGNVSRAMRHLDGVYTQRYNRAHGSDGTLFRGRYKAILIDKDSYLLQVVIDIHLNPVQAKIVREPRRASMDKPSVLCGQRWRSRWFGNGRYFGPIPQKAKAGN